MKPAKMKMQNQARNHIFLQKTMKGKKMKTLTNQEEEREVSVTRKKNKNETGLNKQKKSGKNKVCTLFNTKNIQ